MTGTAFYHAALAAAVGMAAQGLANRFAVPSIVLLLVLGVAVGPDGLGWLDPTVFGAAQADLVALAVTVILFEGALALRVETLRQQQRSLTLLLTAGAGVSMVAGAWAAHALLDMPWSIAALYGALVIVTGPTVVTPLLSRLRIDRSVRDLLVSEGVLIDPIGAIVAIVTAEYVLGEAGVWSTGWSVLVRLGVGALIGGVAGLLLAVALRRRWITDELRNPTVLAIVLVVAAYTSRVSSEAGLMASVVLGVALANAGVPELGRLRAFKEELTVLLLSFVFVLLSADLPLQALRALGWQALVVVGILAWVARPLAVLTCTVGSDLSVRQRLFASWICPRGIVAASVGALFAIALSDAGVAGGTQLEALVFVTVGLTVTVQGLTAGSVARLLGIDRPTLRGVIIVGADRIGRLLARLLVLHGRQAMLIDSNHAHCRAAQADGLPVYHGDALSVDVLEEVGARYVDTVVALTRNQELNTLIGQRVHEHFRIELILTVGEGPTRSGAHAPFPGDFPGLDVVNNRLLLDQSRLTLYEVPQGDQVGRRLRELSYDSGEFALLVYSETRVYVASPDQTLAAGDRLLCCRTRDHTSPLASVCTVIGDVRAREPQRLAPPEAV